ncbi:hypothetical protein D1007_05965 [Hordeum vulgare]|nr:hypothetical protein D1007_05965 [Hordeum vulgare]
MASRNATARDGGTHVHGDSSAAERWSSLPDDLLNTIYLTLAAPIDRVRLAAVCTSWRAVASTHLSSGLLPWLMLDPNGGHGTKYVYSPGEGMVVPRLSLPSEASCRCFVGSHDGGWVASSEMIINLFSGAAVTLSHQPQEDAVRMQQRPRDELVLRKIVFSKQPTVSGCILAAITNTDVLAFCMVGCPQAGWKKPGIMFGPSDSLMDIAFCNDELYGITRSKKLNRYEFGVNQHGAPVLNNIHKLRIQYDSWGCQVRYITELRGKLVMVAGSYPRSRGSIYRPYFTVLELVEGVDAYSSNRKYEWKMMNSLGDHALFLAPTCSKAVPVPVAERNSVQRNRIYISYHCCLRRNDEIPNGANVIFTSLHDDGYRLFYEQDGSAIMGGIMLTGYYTMGGVRPPMWLFPGDM